MTKLTYVCHQAANKTKIRHPKMFVDVSCVFAYQEKITVSLASPTMHALLVRGTLTKKDTLQAHLALATHHLATPDTFTKMRRLSPRFQCQNQVGMVTTQPAVCEETDCHRRQGKPWAKTPQELFVSFIILRVLRHEKEKITIPLCNRSE